jgi:hypothetical protein
MLVLRVILGILFFCVRGILLWIVLPTSILLWLAVLPARAVLGHRYLPLRKLFGWADLNVSAAIAQVVLRPVGGHV